MKVDYAYCRQHKAEKLKEMHEHKLTKKEHLTYEIFSNAIILPAKKNGTLLFGLGGVLTEEGKYVPISGINNRFGGYYECSPDKYADEKVVYCGYLVDHWGHFLIEGVCRLWYFLKKHTDVDKFIFVCDLYNQTEIRGNYKEFFELLGISNKLEIIYQPTQFREVIVPEQAYKPGEYYSEEYRKIFDTVKRHAILHRATQGVNGAVSDKVFLSRSQFANKTEVGVKMLDDFFARNGYLVLYPERLSLTEMIYYLECAKNCAAESGTLPHNMLFSSNEKNVIIIERQDTINEVQVDIDKIKELTVTYVDGYYTIYPVGASYGPYFLCYNEYMRKLAKNHGMRNPNSRYLSDAYHKKCVARYMKIYNGNYGYKWAIAKWQLNHVQIFYESYIDTCKDIGEYLAENKIFKVSQLCKLSCWKRILKKFVCRG